MMSRKKKPIDLAHYRHTLPERWAAYLRANFSGSVSVAFFFGVDDKTARNWMEETTAPRAEVILAMAERDPSVIRFLLSEAA